MRDFLHRPGPAPSFEVGRVVTRGSSLPLSGQAHAPPGSKRLLLRILSSFGTVSKFRPFRIMARLLRWGEWDCRRMQCP